MSESAIESKPKRKRVQVNVLGGRKDNLINFLRSRSSRARNFLHKASTQEHVLYAAISEIAEKKLQLELLQSKWEALNRQKQCGAVALSANNSSQSQISDSDESCSAMGSSTSLSPSLPSDREGFPSPLRHSSIDATDPWDLPLFPSSADAISMDTDIKTSINEHAHTTATVITPPTSSSSVISTRPSNSVRPQLIVPVYREIFHNSGVAMVVLSPSLKVLDFNEAFLQGLPLLTFGPVTRNQLLASGVTLVDFFNPSKELGGLFEKIAQVISNGSWHRDGLVVSERPRLVLDGTYFSTYDSDASGNKRLRYITSLCRYHEFDGKPETVVALRKNRIGQAEPLPLPSPHAQQAPLSDRIRNFVPSFNSSLLQTA